MSKFNGATELAGDCYADFADKADVAAEANKEECYHQCTSNCRRVGCNCECGEWHEKV